MSSPAEVAAHKKKLEEQAGTIKIKYQKILELRNENQAKMATLPSSPFVPSQAPPTQIPATQMTKSTAEATAMVANKPPPHPFIVAAAGDPQSHRRTVSDPSAIMEYQQALMSNSRTIASGAKSLLSLSLVYSFYINRPIDDTGESHPGRIRQRNFCRCKSPQVDSYKK